MSRQKQQQQQGPVDPTAVNPTTPVRVEELSVALQAPAAAGAEQAGAEEAAGGAEVAPVPMGGLRDALEAAPAAPVPMGGLRDALEAAPAAAGAEQAGAEEAAGGAAEAGAQLTTKQMQEELLRTGDYEEGDFGDVNDEVIQSLYNSNEATQERLAGDRALALHAAASAFEAYHLFGHGVAENVAANLEVVGSAAAEAGAAVTEVVVDAAADAAAAVAPTVQNIVDRGGDAAPACESCLNGCHECVSFCTSCCCGEGEQQGCLCALFSGCGELICGSVKAVLDKCCP
jgi:hypothetical protein